MGFLLSLLIAVWAAPADDPGFFVSEEGNYRLTYPKSWKKLRPPNEIFQLALQRGFLGGQAIMVSGLETKATTEDLIENYESDLKIRGDFVKEISRKEIKVEAERAVTVIIEAKIGGVIFTMYLTVFTHQGIAYRVVGVQAAGKGEDFEKEYNSILNRFEFLKERKEWLAKYEGKPARTALLGGLASFDLNRPRWKETTLEGKEYGYLDHGNWKFFPGGAWITVRLEESKRDPASELEILKDSLAGRLQKGKTAPLTIKSRNGEISAVEITGELGENAYVIRGTVLVVDEIAAQLWLECQSSQREATRRDWEQLVGSFHLQAQTKPEHALAFPLRKSFRERAPDPGLAAFLTRATAVIPEPRQHQVRAISADGTRALVQAPEGLVLETIATHKREPLTLKLMYGQPVAVSANGRKVAVATEGEINVVNLDTKFSKRIPVSVSQLTFGPAGDDLIICAHDAPEPGVLEMFRFQTSRLERIKFAGGKSEILVEFPLSRVAHPTVSPDGKWIALVSNRDYPRSVPFGGHLYLLAVDGSHFRQLTKDPEEITSLAWSGDGKWIFAVRRLAVGEKGAVGIGGSPDLYRISPETGEGINLTRSGHIGRVWSSGLDLLLECNAWEVPPSQRGIFRISATELEKATSSRPVPPMADPRRQGRVVGEKVRESLGGDRIKDVVPTPALMAKAAEAFVQGVAQACACPLDFSAASLDRLPSLAEALDLSYGREPAMVLGFGAYYGETLRRVAGAEWELKPVPFGEWIPGRRVAGNPLVEIVMPFSESYRWALHSEEEPVRRSEEILNRIQGQKIILVYPPSHVEETLANKTPENYYKALRMLDAGNVKEGLDHLTVEMQRSPKNGPLAREVIAVCEGARLQEVAKTLTRKAVEAGNEVSELLVRYADDLAPVNPEKALRYYQKAVQGDWVPAEAYFKLGHHYKSMGQTAIAESCWRRAYLSGTLLQRKQIRQLLDIDEPEENEDIPP